MTLFSPLFLGIVLLAAVSVPIGGLFVLRIISGRMPMNDLQTNSFRAGHAHAGVLIALGLVIEVLMSDSRVPAWGAYVGILVLIGAILVPAGFFLSVLGKDPQRRNGLVVLLYLGAVSVMLGALGSGVALVLAGV